MKDNAFIDGIIPPLVTPTDAQGRVLEAGVRRLVDHVIAGGVHGVFALGGAGEFYALDAARRQRVAELVIEQVGGRVPVFLGASAITTTDAVEQARTAEALGANAISVLTPFYVSPSDDELFAHFVAIAKATRLPVVLYTNPDRTGVSMSAPLVERLSEVDNIVAIKDSSGDMTLTAEFIRRTRHRGFKVLAGRDTLIYGTLAHGGAGAVATTANIAPALVVEIYEKFRVGDVAGALDAQFRLNPLRLAFGLGTFPSIAKDALRAIGVDAGEPILPVAPFGELSRQRLDALLRELDLIP
ncbi:MAG: dihydrodipicolinate synthase family protein [Rhodocyclaceae bacterium]